jgi:endonuclease G
METIKSKDLYAAVRARRLAAAYYLSNPRVTLIDVGLRIDETHGGQTTGDLAVRVHVGYKPRQAEFEAFSDRHAALVIQKEKIPFPVVDIIEGTYPLQWWSWYPAEPPSRGRIFDPLCGGISISNEWFNNYGTLGGIVEDVQTGEPMILSNWHVLVGAAYAPRGLRVFQPGRGDGGGIRHMVGKVERDVMVFGLDAAVAKLTGNRSLSNEQFELTSVNGVEMPRLGMQVVKSGRGSEVTRGFIDGVAGDYPIRYGGFLRTIKNVHRIVPQQGTVSVAGDSGSWWLVEGTHKVAALHFAGSDEPEAALAMAMPPVLEALKVRIPSRLQPAIAAPVGLSELVPV